MQNIAFELRKYFSDNKLKLSLTDRYAFAGDAGFYYLLPQAIVQPDSLEDIQQLFLFSKTHAIPLTFRTGGTSLSGQSISEGILVDLSKHWKKIVPLEKGLLVKVEPAAIGAHVNHQLKPYSTKIGPDPASISAAMMGGILSNNSSGMCCGVSHNSYHTLQSIKFVLPNGHIYDSSLPEDYDRFLEKELEIAKGIQLLKKTVIENQSLLEKIKSKYLIKNTVGYSINAFIDFEHPLDILAHLLIGAEGTLAFIAEAVLHTIPDKQFKSTGILFFDNPVVAAEAVPALKVTGADALEMMDRSALRSIEDMEICPKMVKELPSNATAILCEFHGTNPIELSLKLENAFLAIETLPVIAKLPFTQEPNEQAQLWKLRKGMYPSVAAVRAKGTTAMLEDVAVPLESLGIAVTDLQTLFKKYNYKDAIIFGHAKEGNLHFLITQPVNTKEDLTVFEAFNKDLADMIIHKYNGSLKAEHGTGRQIAPFVKDEWGEAAYTVMQDIKNLLDPEQLLNPGVVINDDPECHLKNLKTMPTIEEEVDKCVECGYCENRCPSREYTLTPRQRIQIRRSLQRLKTSGNKLEFDLLKKEFQFSGMDTCAVDGMCSIDCPVSINTGELIKRLRRENHSYSANKIALLVAKNFGMVEWMLKLGIHSGNLINAITGINGMRNLTSGIKKVLPGFPLWTNAISKPIHITSVKSELPDVVYFPSCITRMMGADCKDSITINEVIQGLCKKAGLSIKITDQTAGVCCGQLFSSKGFIPAYSHTANASIEKLWNWTNGGKAPILMDVTSCTHSLQNAESYLTEENKEKFKQMKIVDSIDFVSDYLLPKLTIRAKKNRIVFHPVCTTLKMNLIQKLQNIGNACAIEAVIPFLSGCCGMAGDRGFYFPELTASATKAEALEVKSKKYDGYYSSGKTCEMALSETTGENYQSVFYLLRDVVT